jgi:glycerol-3-phosphate acyltransferase PlsY
MRGALALCLGAYLLGCLTTGYYLVRWLTGRDIRDAGSGSVGARNVGRALGRKGFLLTVALDAGKGALTVVAARHFTADDRLIILAMLAVVAGHIWPVQLRLRGGKGMATSLGSLLLYDPRLALVFVVLFLGWLVLVRRTMLPGLLALACVPPASVILTHSLVRSALLSCWAGLVLVAHRTNVLQEFSAIAVRRTHQADANPPRP